MQLRTQAVLTVAALALLAACDRGPDPRTSGSAATGSSQSRSETPTTPANITKPQTPDEKREGANPVQGQVDPKEGEQHRDFKQGGDAAGPTGPDTTPRR